MPAFHRIPRCVPVVLPQPDGSFLEYNVLCSAALKNCKSALHPRTFFGPEQNASMLIVQLPSEHQYSVLLRYTCPQTGGAIYCQTLLTEHVKFSKSEPHLTMKWGSTVPTRRFYLVEFAGAPDFAKIDQCLSACKVEVLRGQTAILEQLDTLERAIRSVSKEEVPLHTMFQSARQRPMRVALIERWLIEILGWAWFFLDLILDTYNYYIPRMT